MTEHASNKENKDPLTETPARPILVDPLEGFEEALKSETSPPRREAGLDNQAGSVIQPNATVSPAAAQDDRQATPAPSIRQEALLSYVLLSLPVGLAGLLFVGVGWLTFFGFLLLSAASLLGGFLLLRWQRRQVAQLSGRLARHATDPDATLEPLPEYPTSLVPVTLNHIILEALRAGQRSRQDLAASDSGKEALL